MNTITSSKQSISRIKMILIPFSQIGVSFTVIILSAFLVSELKFMGIDINLISFIFGFATLFELIRIYFGHLSDKVNKTRKFIIIGILLIIFGFLLLSTLISSSNNLILCANIFLSITLISMGTSIVSSLIDSHLTAITHFTERTNVSGIIQFSRIFGFTLGAIIGSIFYGGVGVSINFSIFVYIMLSIILILFSISIIAISDDDRIIDDQIDGTRVSNITTQNSLWGKLENLNYMSKGLKYAFLMLLLYPFALFMQDVILEPYTIEILSFDRERIGEITSLAGLVSLLFIPFGMFFARIISRYQTFIFGQLFVLGGLAFFIISTILIQPVYVYCGVIVFNIGTGIISAPTFSYLLDVASLEEENLALVISVFGVLTTISRSFATILSGLILTFSELIQSGNKFFIVFSIELSFAVAMIYPIFQLKNYID